MVVLTFVLLYIPDFVSTRPTGTGAAPGEVVADVGGRTLTAGESAAIRVPYTGLSQASSAHINARSLRQPASISRSCRRWSGASGALEAGASRNSCHDDELAQQIVSNPRPAGERTVHRRGRYQQLLQSESADDRSHSKKACDGV